MNSLISYGGLILVGVVWGVTNPFLEQGVNTKEVKQDFSWKSFLKTIMNYKFILPFAINQGGSLFYYYLLGRVSLSVGPIITNCTNSAVTIVTENIIKGRRFRPKTILGLGFIFLGMSLCLS